MASGKQSTGGFLTGLFFFFGAMLLLGWNEHRTVQNRAAIAEFGKAVVERPVDRIDRASEGGAGLFRGDTQAAGTRSDPRFGVSSEGLRLERDVEMYQWIEKKRTEKDSNGNEVTRYEYRKEWRDGSVDSSQFHDASSHRNPPLPFPAERFYAEDPRLGAYRLSTGQIDELPSERLSLPAELPAELIQQGYRLDAGYFTNSRNLADPAVGDVRLSFHATPVGPLSIAGTARGDALISWTAKNGVEIYKQKPGRHEAGVLVQELHDENEFIKWLLRGGGWLGMVLGLTMSFASFTRWLSVIPLLGPLIQRAVFWAGFALASLTAIVVIAVAWLAVRPLLAGTVIAGTVAAAYLLLRRPAASAPPPPPPGPPPFAPPR
ncbi:MAG: TMEM43 family protein [Xanthomonadales bacterium]|jgi:hypothetical protein|nr:TMEM43 family protein [Xanthomonadales bacterium]